MKTLVMTMIMAMTAATNVFSNNSDNSDRPKFAYNCQVEDEQVTAQQVYRVTDSRLLSRHLEYRFAYDDQGRVIRKEALKWAEASQAYERYYCMEVSYLADGVELRLARWDNDAQEYSQSKERTVYRADATGVDYMAYRWCEQSDEWLLLAMQEMEDGEELLAEMSGECE